MQMLVIVLNKVECLDELLTCMTNEGLLGATVLDSRGMAHILCDEDTPMFGMLRSFINPERKQSKTIFAVLSDEQVVLARRIANDVIGGFSKPDTGIMFSVPTLFIEGLDKE